MGKEKGGFDAFVKSLLTSKASNKKVKKEAKEEREEKVVSE